MSERPILFNTEMVRAILRGEKTQTRRVVKPQPPEDTRAIGPDWYYPTRVRPNGEEYPGHKTWGICTDDGRWATKCPYLPGQTLWVRVVEFERSAGEKGGQR